MKRTITTRLLHAFFATTLALVFAGTLACAGKNAAVTTLTNTQRAERLLNALIAGEFTEATADFDKTMQTALPASKVQATWEWVTNEHGAYVSHAPATIDAHPPYEILLVPITFEKTIATMKVVFNETNEIAGLFFLPPDTWSAPYYVKTNAFTETEITIGKAPWSLPATLSIPKGRGPFPALLLVHGSGPNDRDESIGPNRPFKDIAWGLASKGVLVLRYDKRTKCYAKEMVEQGVRIDARSVVIDDAKHAIAALSSHASVDKDRIFVLGHSLGGMFLPRIVKDTKVKGAVAMAAPARPFTDVLRTQIPYLLGLDGVMSEADSNTLAMLDEAIALVNSDALSPETPKERLPLGIDATFWIDLRSVRAAEEASALSIPFLVLQGGRDYQVTMSDFAVWQRMLSTRRDALLRPYPSLNHLMMEGQKKSTPKEYTVLSHVHKTVIDDIARFMGIRDE